MCPQERMYIRQVEKGGTRYPRHEKSGMQQRELRKGSTKRKKEGQGGASGIWGRRVGRHQVQVCVSDHIDCKVEAKFSTVR